MTEDKGNALSGVAKAALSTGGVAVPALAAYAFQVSRTAAYTDHFGVPFRDADPRELALFVSILGMGVLILVWYVLLSVQLMWLLRPHWALVPLGLLFALLPPHGWVAQAVKVGGVAVIWAVIGLVRHAVRRVRNHPWSLWFVGLVDPRRDIRTPPGLWLVTTAVMMIVGGSMFGTWIGRLGARGMDEFAVTSRDAGRATVVFTTEGKVIERVLDISSGPDGRPRNEWLPEVVVRPMPPGGITYQQVRLGPTKPSRPVGP